MSPSQTCPKCGAPILKDALGGLCRKCLGLLGFCSPEAEVDRPGVLPGRCRFGDYELIEELARGGMGVVYKARQVSLHRTVAVKMILHGPFSSPEFVQRFQTEARAAAALHHPNIVAIYEVGQQDGQHYFSMEYIEGRGLAELVRDKPLPAERAATYVRTMAEAMHYAHTHGILHRDLKPSNVLLDAFDQPRITDFGLAKLLNGDSQLTVTGQALGSPNHMPPEQAAGQHATGPEGDIYSLGAILYHLITGRPPFQGETIQSVLLQVQDNEPIPPRRLNPSVPVDLQTICVKCLSKNPAHRYRSAQALGQDLARFLAREPILARPVSPARRAWLWCRRHPGPAALTTALVLAVACGLAGVLWEWARAERHAFGESRQRRLAEDYATKTRLNLYAADVSLASQAIQRGNFGLARRTLAALQPQPGEEDLRGFEWRYLWNLCRGDQLATLTGHNWIVTCATFSPDCRWVATGSQDGTTRIWDVQRRGLLVTLTNCPATWSVAFSPDGRLLITGGTCGVRLFRTDTWGLVTNYPGELATISKTGTLLAAAESSPFYWERAGHVAIWDYSRHEKLADLTMPGRTLSLSPDGRLLAVAAQDRGVRIYRLSPVDASLEQSDSLTEEPAAAAPTQVRCQLLQTFPTDASVWSLAFSPDGKRLLTAGWSSEVLVWDVSGSARENTTAVPTPARLIGHNLTVWCVGFSPDGATIITAGSDQTIRLWDATTLQPKAVLRGHDNEVWCVAFSPDGQMLASGGKDQTVRLWPADLPERADQFANPGGAPPLFSPDGTRALLADSSAPEPQGQVWDVQQRRRLEYFSAGIATGFSPDGQRIVRAINNEATLEFWSPGQSNRTSVNLEGLAPGGAQFVRAGFSPRYESFFGIDQTGRVRCWAVSSGHLLGSVQGPPPPIRCAILGPGGRQLAVSVERENWVRLFDVANAREMQLVGHQDFVSGIAFSPDGATLATGSMDGTIRLWDTGSGHLLGRLPGHMEEVTDVAFSPDARTLASLGHKESVKLWHLATQRELVSLDFPQAGMFLAFSPDGRYLSVTTEDDMLRLFEAPPIHMVQEKGVPSDDSGVGMARSHR